MSRIGKVSINIPDGTKVDVSGQRVNITGALGKESYLVHPGILINMENNVITLRLSDTSKAANDIFGTNQKLLSNKIIGVSAGFEKRLVLVGVGFKAQTSGSALNLQVGYSHSVSLVTPSNLTVTCPSLTEIIVKGTDCSSVGQHASIIRGVRPPEPYKGKGIRYAGEKISLKETKKK